MGARSGRNRCEISMLLLIEAGMLLKINGVRRDSGKFSDRTRFFIPLNLNRLSYSCERGGAHVFYLYVQTRNIAENKRRMKR
jgi:hypothetical protein